MEEVDCLTFQAGKQQIVSVKRHNSTEGLCGSSARVAAHGVVVDIDNPCGLTGVQSDLQLAG